MDARKCRLNVRVTRTEIRMLRRLAEWHEKSASSVIRNLIRRQYQKTRQQRIDRGLLDPAASAHVPDALSVDDIALDPQDPALTREARRGSALNRQLLCGRCLHRWFPRRGIRPHECPACRSPRWSDPPAEGQTVPPEIRRKAARCEVPRSLHDIDLGGPSTEPGVCGCLAQATRELPATPTQPAQRYRLCPDHTIMWDQEVRAAAVPAPLKSTLN